MIDFEDQLRAALSPKEPSPDFVRNVLRRAERPSRWRPWAAGCIAASLLIGSIGALNWRERRREEIAGARLVQALEITSSRLQRIHKRVESIN